MEEWNSEVRKLKDESDDPVLVKDFCYRIFQDLKRLKIKDKKKFGQRLGPDYENWKELLEMDYPKILVKEILGDDDFWKLTWKVTRSA
jgi:hypothetical protein